MAARGQTWSALSGAMDGTDWACRGAPTDRKSGRDRESRIHRNRIESVMQAVQFDLVLSVGRIIVARLLLRVDE